MDRIMGVLTLKAPVYRQIAEDTSATTMAAIIVAVVSLITGVSGAFLLPGIGLQLPANLGGASANPILDVVRTVVFGLVGWVIVSWIMGVIAKLLGGKTNTGEMLRVLGFAWIFNLLGIIPCVGLLLGLILSIAATVLGIREAASVSTGKAVAVGIVGFIAFAVIAVVISFVLGLVLGPTGVLG